MSKNGKKDRAGVEKKKGGMEEGIEERKEGWKKEEGEGREEERKGRKDSWRKREKEEGGMEEGREERREGGTEGRRDGKGGRKQITTCPDVEDPGARCPRVPTTWHSSVNLFCTPTTRQTKSVGSPYNFVLNFIFSRLVDRPPFGWGNDRKEWDL